MAGGPGILRNLRGERFKRTETHFRTDFFPQHNFELTAVEIYIYIKQVNFQLLAHTINCRAGSDIRHAR